MLESIRKTAAKYVIVGTILAFLPIAWISFYNHPTSDDYNYSSQTREALDAGAGPIGALTAAAETSARFYQTWQGQYTAAFMLALQPGLWGAHEEFYALTMYIVCGSLLIGIYFLLKAFLFFFEDAEKYALPIALSVWLVVIEGQPNATEGMFWFAGAVTYNFYLGLFFWQCGGMLLLIRETESFAKEKGKRRFFSIFFIVSFLAFFVGGGTQILSFMAVLVGVGFVVYAILHRKKSLTLAYMLLTLVSLAGFLANMLAPGTFVRAAGLERASLGKTLVIAILEAVSALSDNISLPIFLLVCVLTVFLLPSLKQTGTKCRFRYLLLLGMLAAALYCASVCVPYYAMSYAGAGRVRDMRFGLFVVFFSMLYIYFLGCVANVVHSRKRLYEAARAAGEAIVKEFSPTGVRKAVLGFIVVSLFGMGIFKGNLGGMSTSYSCLYECLSGEAQGYDAERDANGRGDLNNPENMPNMIYCTSANRADYE